ncbi:cobalamin-binding protein [Chitinimonas koreensis]|uniref:cobalamin-binding protein n=1 Tax=Chitinimonas koreensis TaxID=356302 RepID=UPI000429BEEA|nr:cobalamin-binding protein [Chitinimonas koreensis]QNM98596.1 cobalamin-binding protein [Chitinimonas koreensis]
MKGPRRIACLSAETVDTLYRLGAQDRIVGVTGFARQPPEARRDKPRLGGFTSADVAQVARLEPDLVLCYSDMQAELAAQLARAGLAVHLFNQRDIAGILAMIELLGAMVDETARAAELVARLQAGMDEVAAQAATLPRRPRVYFELWDAPLMCAPRWVSELIALAGGEDCFAELSHHAAGRDRVIADPQEVVRRAPELIFASGCNQRFTLESLAERPGWDGIPAVVNGEVHGLPAPTLLQPGPTVLDEGLRALTQHIQKVDNQ